MSENDLLNSAREVRSQAYAPYSKFKVGAAILAKSGKIFVGCNVENLSLRLTMCAEQAAVGSAVASGERDFIAIAVIADSKEPVLPCGACRQMLAEFNPQMQVVTAGLDGNSQTFSLSDLLPRPKQGILEPPNG